jgi:1-phosphofructokinase family hexose kinase
MNPLPTILCVSANPAIDRRLRLPSLSPGEVNRVNSAESFPGGKAAHVAMAAHALGARAVWMGFLGGAIGEECAAGLRSIGIEVHPVHTRAATRVNLEIIEDSGRITEVLEPGGQPDASERDEMLRAISEGLRGKWKGALLVISGSLPAGMPGGFYASLIASARKEGATVFLDTSGEALLASLAAMPDLVKPNRRETEALLGQPVRDVNAAVAAAQQLIARGARSAVITLGAEGLVWLDRKDGSAWLARPPHLNPISTVGCGDTTLAGLAFASLQRMEPEAALRLAAACGAANCLAQQIGKISQADVQSLLPQIEVERITAI